MEAQFNNPTYSDIQIKLIDSLENSTVLSLHRVILASKSEFFDRMFQSGMREAEQKTVEVQVSDLEEAIELLKWMYSGERIPPSETEELVRMWLIGNIIDPEYPEPRGNFRVSYIGEDTLIFISKTPSSIDQVNFLFDEQNGIQIGIVYERKNSRRIKEYLRGRDIESEIPNTGVYMTKTIKEVSILSNILLNNNNFSQEDVKRIKNFLSRSKQRSNLLKS